MDDVQVAKFDREAGHRLLEVLQDERTREVFAHLAPYVGVPRALAGLRVATAALTEGEGVR